MTDGPRRVRGNVETVSFRTSLASPCGAYGGQHALIAESWAALDKRQRSDSGGDGTTFQVWSTLSSCTTITRSGLYSKHSRATPEGAVNPKCPNLSRFSQCNAVMKGHLTDHTFW